MDIADGKLDGERAAVIGSWNLTELSSEPNADVWLALVLKTDDTFYMWPEAGDGLEGTYALKQTDTDPARNYLVLTPKADDSTATEEIRREYRVEDGALFVRRTSRASWREMEKSERAVCVVKADCSLQNLRKPACVGSWECDDAEGACRFDCR